MPSCENQRRVMKKTKVQMARPFLYALLIGCLIQSAPACAETLRLQRDGPLARDYFNKLEWMRCSIGQVWQDETCQGEIKMLTVAQAEQISAVMRENWGGGWRLPTVKELKGLIQKNVEAPKIDGETFPNTHQGSYWTSDQSFYTDQYFWTVNFYTGQLYNRFFYFQENAVRLVRDYSFN